MDSSDSEFDTCDSDEGKDYITVAFGCTGGIHRSVVSSEMFFSFLKHKKDIEVFIDHRDL